ncbi:hypothetical protein J3Q64DRAFT_1346207 [Phycomyces blakesleeanus]|uniref:Uncharacterized protein n=1 Tax=Phycomyces blakesleeanus TaxID=4837 RepID=A0ABR3AMU4_PHYBL
MVSFRISCLPREHFSTENQSKNCPNQAEVRRTDRVSALDPQRSRSTPTERNKRHQWKSVKLMSNVSYPNFINIVRPGTERANYHTHAIAQIYDNYNYIIFLLSISSYYYYYYYYYYYDYYGLQYNNNNNKKKYAFLIIVIITFHKASTKDISECLHKRAFTNPIYESSAHYSTLSIESTSSMATDSSSSLVLQTNLHAALVPLDVKSPTSTPRQMQAEEALRITRGHHRQSSDPGKDSIQRQEQPTELSPQSIWNDSNQSTLGCSECFGNLSSSINSSDSNGNEDDDDDNGKAMILEDWHRASLWNVDWSNVFSTHTELWRASQLFDHLIAVRHNPVQNGNEHTRSVPIGFGHNWTDTDADAEVDADTDADAEVDADTDAETENKK